MKKLLVLLCALFVGIMSVSAMSESDLIKKLSEEYKVNGATYKISSSQKTAMEQYLNQYDISSEDADFIAKKVDAAFDVLRKSGKQRFYDMTQAEKQQVKDLVIEVANNTSVKVAIVKDNLVVYKPGTSDIFYETPIYPVNGDIVQTSRGLTVAIAGVISVIGIAAAVLVVRNKAKANA